MAKQHFKDTKGEERTGEERNEKDRKWNVKNRRGQKRGVRECSPHLSAALLYVVLYCGWPGKDVMESCIYNMVFMFSFRYE